MSCPLHFFFHGNPGMFYAARFKKRAALFRGVFSRAISGIIRASQTWGFGKVYRNSCFKLCGVAVVVFQITWAESGAAFFHAKPPVLDAGIVP